MQQKLFPLEFAVKVSGGLGKVKFVETYTSLLNASRYDLVSTGE